MSRAEFSAAIKVKRLNFAEFKCEAMVTRDDGTKVRCNAVLTSGRVNYDHDTADGLGGKATFENCRAICRQCHKDKTRDDVAAIAQAKRREAAHLGIAKDAAPIRSAPFTRSSKTIRRQSRDVLELPPRRSIYQETT